MGNNKFEHFSSQQSEWQQDKSMKWSCTKSIMEVYPEYGFRPTSLILGSTKKPSFIHKLLGVIYIAIGMTAFVVSFLLDDDFAIVPMCFFTGIIICILGLVFIITAIINENKCNVLTDVADYISTKHSGKFYFFVKNHKFGVLKNNYNIIQIPAVYDKLSWKEKGQILVAEKNGETFLIDIYGNRLS